MDAQTRKSQYENLNQHFQACLDLVGRDREHYISKLAASNPALERELRGLLRFHEVDADTPAAPALPTPTETPRDNTRTRRKKSWLSAPVLILLVGGTSLVSILSVQVWALARLEGDLKQQMASNLKAAVDLRVSNVRAWMASQKQQALKILQDPILATHVATLIDAAKTLDDREARKERLKDHPSTAAVAEHLRHAPPAISDRGFAVLSSAGVCVATYEPLLGVTLTSAGASYLGRVNLGETVISRPYPDWSYSKVLPPDSKNPVMFVAGPIRDAEGQVIALGSFRFNPSHLYEILTAANAEFVAFDAKGQVLNNLSDGAELQAWGVASAPDTALHAYLRDPGVDLTSGKRADTAPQSWSPTVMSLSATQGHDGIDAVGQRDLRGHSVVAAWAWIPEWELGIGGSMPVATVLAPVAPVRTAFNVLLGVFAVLTAALFGSTRFLRIRRRMSTDSPFGAYQVERPVGKGGMAEVFLARHAFLRRPAALKILSQRNPDAATVDRFEREARFASRLAHPNTIQVFDFGETPDGRLYYAMEFVEGVTLAQFLTLDGPPPVARAVYLLRQVAGSLREAHQLDLLHRDLKPSNIMLTARGGLADIVKVLDFGIACSLTPGTEDFTQTTALVGTPAFLAPERIRAPHALDIRSDIYAFGAVAFTLLTGRQVFEGSNATELLYQVMTAPRPSPSQLRGKPLPAALEKLILDCLSVEPEGRPSSIQEIEAVLESAAFIERWTQEQAREWWSSNQSKVASFMNATR